MKRNEIYIYLLLCVLIANCNIDPYIPVVDLGYSVSAILQTNKDTAFFSLAKVRSYKDDAWNYISTATLTLNDNVGKVWTSTYNASIRKYVIPSFRAQSNQKYFLTISIPDGKGTVITGETKVPAKTRFTIANRLFTWNATNQTITKINIVGNDTVSNIFGEKIITNIYKWEGATTTNSITIPKILSQSTTTPAYTFKNNKYYNIQYSVYDTNASVFILNSPASMGLKNGYGFFGSTYTIDTTIKLVE